MEQAILYGVGKKMRNSFLQGKVTPNIIMQIYAKNKKEADNFSGFGYSMKDLLLLSYDTHNPLLRTKLESFLTIQKEKNTISKTQNITSLEKLEFFMHDALGIGLRKVIANMRKYAKLSHDMEAKAVLMLLETEFANLSAKKNKKIATVIYERKDILLDLVTDYINQLGWTYGGNYNTGKNAAFLIYIYLPNGVQLTWHCNDYQTIEQYPIRYDLEWDGQVCMTMEKILDFIKDRNYMGKLEQMTRKAL